MSKILCLVLILLSFFSKIADGKDLTQAQAAIHISSTISDGKYTIPEIVDIARGNNIKVVILTDRDLMRWQYGLWPLRNIIKRAVESSSVFTYGIERYLGLIKEVQDKNPDLILIPGVESAPFYYWEGNPLNNSLKLHNWHKHILAIGLEEADDYRNLPVTGNRQALWLPFRLKDIFRFWPILILLAGFFCLYSRPRRIFCGITLLIIGFLFCVNNYPFRGFVFNQYQGDLGIKPYQNFINYINRHQGVTFWAHPEAENIQKVNGVSVETREHTSDLLAAKDYTGFAIFYEGYKQVGYPGGIWDRILRQYCEGKRRAPIWAIAGLSFDTTGDLANRIRTERTVFLVPELSKPAVLQALRQGKMYVMRGEVSSRFILDEFSASDSLSDIKGMIADEIKLKGNPVIKISGHFLDGQAEPVTGITIRLIRNGDVVKTFEVSSPFDVEYPDDYSDDEKEIYYRVEIACQGQGGGIIVTNPIFIKFDN